MILSHSEKRALLFLPNISNDGWSELTLLVRYDNANPWQQKTIRLSPAELKDLIAAAGEAL